MATPAATPTPPFPAGRRSRLDTALARRRNPLWRPSDSLRNRLRVLLVVGLLASVGLSVGFALAVYRGDRATALRRGAELHSVQAVLLTAPGRAPAAADSGAEPTAVAGWSEPDGTVHRASVTVLAPGRPRWRLNYRARKSALMGRNHWDRADLSETGQSAFACGACAGVLMASGWGSPVRAARAVATSGRPART